jgi:hypothetical protein
MADTEREKLEVVEARNPLLIVGEVDANHTRCASCGCCDP